MAHSSVGLLRYSRVGEGYKLSVEVDPEISALARALVPKTKNLKPQRYAPHISVVRNEIPTNLEMWGKHEGGIAFSYNPEVRNDEQYYWLEVVSTRLTEIRLELGLPASSPWSRPPDGAEVFHVTIGNTKQLLV